LEFQLKIRKKMAKLDREKIKLDKVRNYPTVNEALDKECGLVGTASREKFTEQAQAFFTGQLIEDARKNADLTQEELAKRIGSTKLYISRIENGETDPKLNTFFRIASALGLSVDLNPIHS
jgi:DNA-binding XRE family transcriptional regulator